MKELTIYSLRPIPQDVKSHDVLTKDILDDLSLSEVHTAKNAASADGIYRIPLTLTSTYADMDDIKAWLLSSGAFSEKDLECWSLAWEYDGGRIAKAGDKSIRIPANVIETLKREHTWDALCENVGNTESYELPYRENGYRILEPWCGQKVDEQSLKKIVKTWLNDLNASDMEYGVQYIFPLAEILVLEFNKAKEEGGAMYFIID